MSRHRLPALLLSALAVLGGCRRGEDPPISAWVAGEMMNLTDRTPARNDDLVFDRVRNTVRLISAANETVSFQLVVDAGQTPVESLRVECSDLAATNAKIPAANVRFFKALGIDVTDYPPWYLRLVDAVPGPAKFYDPLVPSDAPAGGQPYNLAAAERLVVWVDLYVPRDAAADTYTGALRLTSDTHREWNLSLSLRVYDFVLPDARPLAAVGGFDHGVLMSAMIQRDGKGFVPSRIDRQNPLVRQGLVLMRHLMRQGHDHRLDLFDRRIRPDLKRDTFGKVQLDWEEYDAVVMPYLNGTAFEDRIGSPAWPMPFCEDFPRIEGYGGLSSDLYASTAAEVVTLCRQHFSKSLQNREQTFLWPYRGPAGPEGYEKYIQLARLARGVDAQTPILSQLPADPPPQTLWKAPEDFPRLTGIYAAPAEYFDPLGADRLARPENPLLGAWLAPGQPPYLPSLGVIATAADVRAIPWFAMKYRCTGLFLDEVLHWQGDIFRTAAGAETRLFYPGTPAGIEGVLPSVRLKRLRRGLQDITYLWLLRQRQRDAVADSIIDAMTRYAGLAAVGDNYLDPRLNGWVQDARAWDLARRLLVEEVQDAIRPSPASNNRLLAERLAWRSLDDATRSIHVEQVRARVRPGAGEKLEATILLDLYNQYSRAVDLLVKADSLPPGWKGGPDEARVAPFGPASRKTVTLKAVGDYVPAGGTGKMSVPVSLVVDKSRRIEVDAVVPFLVAGQVAKAPRIDGELNDWPMKVGNTAGDFKLIGRRGESGKGLAQRQTLAFVLYDDKNLYVAFRCSEPRLEGLVAKPNNLVHYEQLMACGEDLVEIILDPGLRAKGPEDLYHIAVKPNGVLLTERGVQTSPPLGRAGPWSVSATVAVARQADVWIVELAIPLEAFGAAGKERFWGVNFTRFATQGSEASSWSQAPRYFYDPRNLATMFLAPVK